MNRKQVLEAHEAIQVLDFVAKQVFGKEHKPVNAQYRVNSLGSPEIILKPDYNGAALRALYDQATATLKELGVSWI